MTSKTHAILICLVSMTATGSANRFTKAKTPTSTVHSQGGKVQINVLRSDVYYRPSASSATVGWADRLSEAQVLSVTTRWARVRFVTGLTGWVSRRDLSPANAVLVDKPLDVPTDEVETSELAREMDPKEEKKAASSGSRSRLLSRAASFRGVRYVYGAASRSATDCSGFTSQVYRSIGVKLPRISWIQATVGKAVSKKDLAPGDLIFFRTRGTGRVSHVGIYTGDNQFIHASSSSGRVTYNGLGESYYAKRYAGARRVIALGTGLNAQKAAQKVLKEAKKLENKPWVNPIGVVDGGSGEIER